MGWRDLATNRELTVASMHLGRIQTRAIGMLLAATLCAACGGSSRRIAHFLDDDGQDLIEYALLSALLAVGFVLTLQTLVNGIIPFFDAVIAALRSV